MIGIRTEKQNVGFSKRSYLKADDRNCSLPWKSNDDKLMYKNLCRMLVYKIKNNSFLWLNRDAMSGFFSLLKHGSVNLRR